MNLSKAVITAAGPTQRGLPLQTLVDRDGVEKKALEIIVEEAVGAGADEVCVVVAPGDEAAYRLLSNSFVECLVLVSCTDSVLMMRKN